MKKNQISFTTAFKELQEILADIQDQEVDLDQLSEKVKRARFLIDFCEKKIKGISMEVKKATKSLK